MEQFSLINCWLELNSAWGVNWRQPATSGSAGKKMSDIIVDYGSLPDDIREKLAELELELSEGKSKECPMFQPYTNYPQPSAVQNPMRNFRRRIDNLMTFSPMVFHHLPAHVLSFLFSHPPTFPSPRRGCEWGPASPVTVSLRISRSLVFVLLRWI